MIPAVTSTAKRRARSGSGRRNDAAKRKRQYGITRSSATNALATVSLRDHGGVDLDDEGRPPRMANDKRDPTRRRGCGDAPTAGRQRGQQDELHQRRCSDRTCVQCQRVDIPSSAASPSHTRSGPLSRFPRPGTCQTLPRSRAPAGGQRLRTVAGRPFPCHSVAQPDVRRRATLWHSSDSAPGSSPSRDAGPPGPRPAVARYCGPTRWEVAWRRTGRGPWCTGRSRPRTPSASAPSTPTCSTGRSGRASSWRSPPGIGGPEPGPAGHIRGQRALRGHPLRPGGRPARLAGQVGRPRRHHRGRALRRA